MDQSADDSSFEISLLLRTLPVQNSHKKRLKALSRFYEYVTTPDDGAPAASNWRGRSFYDDDVLWLLTGHPPSGSSESGSCGLVPACGEPSSSTLSASSSSHAPRMSLASVGGKIGNDSSMSSDQHRGVGGGLKRSAANAIRLLFYLVFEARVDDGDEAEGGSDGDLNNEASTNTSGPSSSDNVFLETFVSLPFGEIELMSLSDHLTDDSADSSRSGSLVHAFALILLLLNRRKDGQSSSFGADGRSDGQLTLEMLLPDLAHQQTYLSLLRKFQSEQSPGAGRAAEAPHQGKSLRAEESDWKRVCSIIFDAVTKRNVVEEDLSSAIGSSSLEIQSTGDPKRDDPIGYELGLYSSSVTLLRDAPTTWEASGVSKKLAESADKAAQAKVASALCLESDSEIGQQMNRGVKSDDERAQQLSRDPLGIRDETFDLRSLEIGRRKVFDGTSNDTESKLSREGSVLPTDSNFAPLLFLTLVHPEASFQELTQALTRLEGVADNHAMRLQRLVRDNFPLFVRCAEGIDWFAENIGEGCGGQTNAQDNDDGNAVEKLAKLEALVAKVGKHSDEAFGPLLDNTLDVRRTKNALAILSRVGPILSVPNLMASHLQGGRIAEAVNAYRKVRLINETCGVDLLKSVRAKAMEAAAEARSSLTKLLSSPDASTQKLLSAIRDLKDLDDLDDKRMDAGLKEDGVKVSPQPSTAASSSVESQNPALFCLQSQAKHFDRLAVAMMKACTDSLRSSMEKDARLKNFLRNEHDVQRESENEHIKRDLAELSSDGPRYFDEDDEDEAGTGAYAFSHQFSGAQSSLKSAVYTIRVASCDKINLLVRQWLPRLMRISSTAYDIENQLLASGQTLGDAKRVKEFLEGDVSDSLMVLVELSGQNALGRDLFEAERTVLFSGRKGTSEEGKEGKRTSFPNIDYCKTCLPSGFNSKCAQSLSGLSETIAASTASARGMRGYAGFGGGRSNLKRARGLEACSELVELAIIECEKRWCSNALSHCARNCTEVATAKGHLDVQAVVRCVKRLREDLHRGFECGERIEDGVRGCLTASCTILREISKERNVAVNLGIIKETARALSIDLIDLMDAMGGLGGQQEEVLSAEYALMVKELEESVWKDYLVVLKENVREGIENKRMKSIGKGRTFPAHLSCALLCIVKNRALIEENLPIGRRPMSGVELSYGEEMMRTSCDELLKSACEAVYGGWEDHAPDVVARGVEIAFLVEQLERHAGQDMVAVVRQTLKDLVGRVGAEEWAKVNVDDEKDTGTSDTDQDSLTVGDMRRKGRILMECLY
ncbi:hypothetical protein TrST_g9457 [Triparma strigata]|uniref:Exocyst complex component EXOC2/Sec5 N-terminal domain-containing protein n=1 Tax=Triparma strigata TaxID=1606541 RepID=A0A9W7APS6_9STRA|nr:hypothetical protein TrST_g9457 [Triparma strigata]